MNHRESQNKSCNVFLYERFWKSWCRSQRNATAGRWNPGIFQPRQSSTTRNVSAQAGTTSVGSP